MTKRPDRRLILAGATGLIAMPISGSALDTQPRVTTRLGTIVGRRQGGVSVFKGIPYGVVPQRFGAPTTPPIFETDFAALNFGPSSPQKNASEPDQSESCLVLNIYTPACDHRRRPVVFYIHGGAYMNGSASNALYDGQALAHDENIVVVTVNHRLNVFGYLYLAQLERHLTGAQTQFGASGNAGQMDLVLALKWVKAEIAGFGGNPNCVTVFGQSGGGAKIATLMAQPMAKGLFHRATTMSGQQVTASGANNATKRAVAYLNALGLKPDEAGLKSILSAPVKDMLSALGTIDPILGSGGVYMGPVLDEIALMRHPFYPDCAPQSRHIPMMIGNTLDETRGFLGNDPTYTKLELKDLAAKLPAQYRVDIDPYVVIDTYRRLYPHYSASDVFFAATTAGRSWRGAIIEAEERAKAKAPAYVYQLNWRSEKDNGQWGAAHTMDIPLMFKTTSAPNALSGDTKDARRMAAIMSHSLANFARTGIPNSPDLPKWVPYGLERRETMLFNLKPQLAHDPRGAERRLFEKVPFVQAGT